MDGPRFDRLTRAFASTSSRRSAIKALIGFTGAVAGAAVTQEADARTIGSRPTIPPPPPPACPAGQMCNGTCCTSGQTCCNGACCTGSCTNGLCCPPQTSACGSNCCPAGLACCGNQCCDPSLCSPTGSHCCAAGTNVCGEECCQPGDDCCDGECCFGVCFGEEMCCPRPQIVCQGGCCPPGDIVCCDIDGCCDGACTAGGLCCPAGTSVCGETCCDNASEDCCGTICIPKEGCCSDSECTLPETCGGGGVAYVCGCTVTSTCQNMGLNCGTFTNNCNLNENCGTCTPPNSCNASPAGVCHCVTEETCAGRCGSFTDVCGVVHECEACPTTTTMQPVCTSTQTCASQNIVCGSFVDECGVNRQCNECGTCRQCNASNQCEPSPQFTDCGVCRACDGAGTCGPAPGGVGFPCERDKCTVGSTCASDGSCQGGMPMLCFSDPLDRCSTTSCDPNVGCVTETAQFNGQTCSSDNCDPGICSNGSCLSDPVDCPDCQVCDPENGQCIDNPGVNGNSCGTGGAMVCVQGNCCNMLGGPGPLEISFYKECISETTCCAESEGPCCPGTNGACCEDCFEILDPGGTFVSGLCCPEIQMCDGQCCWFGRSCVGGTACVRDEQICQNGTCADRCCGGNGSAGSGTCCGPDAYCVVGATTSTCVPVQTCTDDSAGDAACVAAGFGSSAVCAGGTCCPNPRQVGFGSGGRPQYSCCGPQQGRSASGQCCGYPNYSGQCNDCNCSFSQVRRVTR